MRTQALKSAQGWFRTDEEGRFNYVVLKGPVTKEEWGVHIPEAGMEDCANVKMDGALSSDLIADEPSSCDTSVATNVLDDFDSRSPSRAEPRIVRRPRQYGSFY